MSAEPERKESEREAIAEYAYELWEQDPTAHTDDLDRWLTSEAVLQTKGAISARPVSLPFFISFTASGVPPSHEKSVLRWIAPRPKGGFMQRSLAVTEVPWAGASPEDLAFLDNQMPHDGRLLTLQVTAAIAALDRIARFLDAVCVDSFAGIPPGNFAEPLGNGFPGWRLKRTHLMALLDPEEHPLELADFEGYLGNNPVAQDVGVNVVWISLGSHARIIAEIRAGNWKKASRLLVIVLALGLAGGIAHGVGENIGEYLAPPAVIERAMNAGGDLIGQIESKSAHFGQDVANFTRRAYTAAGPAWPPLVP